MADFEITYFVDGPNCGGVHKQAKITFKFWFLILPEPNQLASKRCKQQNDCGFLSRPQIWNGKNYSFGVAWIGNQIQFFSQKTNSNFFGSIRWFDNKTINDSVMSSFRKFGKIQCSIASEKMQSHESYKCFANVLLRSFKNVFQQRNVFSNNKEIFLPKNQFSNPKKMQVGRETGKFFA